MCVAGCRMMVKESVHQEHELYNTVRQPGNLPLQFDACCCPGLTGASCLIESTTSCARSIAAIAATTKLRSTRLRSPGPTSPARKPPVLRCWVCPAG